MYIHIPFCKQACHYCDFHFSTSMKKKDDMVLALAKEIGMRKNELLDSARSDNEIVETIYFGGGTPSVLSNDDINFTLLRMVLLMFRKRKLIMLRLEVILPRLRILN